MDPWIPEIRRMAELLENEISGRPVDRNEAQALAHRLARQFPQIRESMGQIARRLTGAARIAS